MDYRLALIVICLCASVLRFAGVQAASFNCAKASKPVEHAICNDAQLNDADTRLGHAYTQLRKQLSKAEYIFMRNAQRRWLAWRDQQCPGAVVDCLLPLYEQRIESLKFRLAPEFPVSAAGRASGDYRLGKHMRLYSEAISPNLLQVEIIGVDPVAARWVCRFNGVGSISRDGKYVHHVDDNNRFSITFQDTTAVIEASAVADSFCGAGGSLSGTYTRNIK
jgi:uncharacterized protein YecT (DUF1311 family)